MRRASRLALQLASRPGVIPSGGACCNPAGASLPAALSALQQQLPPGARGFAADASHEPPKVVPNPLQQIVPPLIKYTGVATRAARDGVVGAIQGALTSSAAKGAVTYFADNVLFGGTLVDLEDVDVAKWAHWLAGAGYTNPEGWAKIVAWGAANAAKLSAAEVTALVDAMYSVGRYDRDLFSALQPVIQEKFMELDTAGAARIVAAYAANSHWDQELFDDLADSIAYCNHYLSPTTVSLQDITAVFSAYAKYGHDRADLFTTLSRAVFEDRLRALPTPKDLNHVVMGLLRAFNTLEFWPDCSEALLVAVELNPGAFAAEKAEVEAITAKLEGYAGGKLPWLEGGYKDWEHFEGRPFGEYNLYVFRDELVPQYYKPSDIKVWKQ